MATLSSFLQTRLAALPTDAPVLDAGGWLKPLERATHVIDAMPYQTRRARLSLERLPGERFTAETWFYADFLEPKLRLPFPDKFFAFAYCGQTVEDLADPEPLLRELCRVSRAGAIESPSRLTEQTAGVRDRMSASLGHPHHRWILDPTPDRLELCSKSALNTLPRSAHAVPLITFERRVDVEGASRDCQFAWTGDLRWTVLSPEESRRRAITFRDAVGVRPGEVWRDSVTRRLRQVKSALLRRPKDDPAAWFAEMLRLSAPFRPSHAKNPR